MSDKLIPTDFFSRRRRELIDNPGAIRSTSTVETADFYGNLQTWNVDTFRVDGRDEVFVQRNDADGGARFYLPAEVTAALSRHRDRATTAIRRRAGRTAIATRINRGDTLGNPDALRKARASRKTGGAR